MKKTLTLAMIGFIAVTISLIGGCNTVKGFGKDVSKGGREIQRAASLH